MSTNEKTSYDSGTSMAEITRDLRNTRQSVKELMTFRTTLMANKKGIQKMETDQMNEYKHRAISAINYLFDDDLSSKS